MPRAPQSARRHPAGTHVPRGPWTGSAACAAPIAVLASALLAASHAGAQVLIPQPEADFVTIDLQSLQDEVHVVGGDLGDAPYLYRAWSNAPQVELVHRGAVALLRVWDRALLADEGSAQDTWEIELMPRAPCALTLRFDRAQAAVDFGGMKVRDVNASATSSELRFHFGRVNPIPLESFAVTMQGGELDVKGLLDARPERVQLQLARCKTRLEFTGSPFEGEASVTLRGDPDATILVLPRSIALRVEAPPAVLAGFSANSDLTMVKGTLSSRGFATAGCRLRLQVETELRGFEVRWQGEAGASTAQATAGPSAPVPAGSAETPAQGSGDDAEFQARVRDFFFAVDRGDFAQAEVVLGVIRSLRPGDSRLPVLDGWLSYARRKPQTQRAEADSVPELERRFHAALHAYVLGQYEEALAGFRSTASLDPSFSPAQSWIRRTESEMQRLQGGSGTPLSPRVTEKVVQRSSAPVFGLRNPAGPLTKTRSATLQLAGQVGDDTGIDHVEITLNGRSLLDARGQALIIRPEAGAAPAKKLSFATAVPLQKGENQLVATAFDNDVPAHWSSEQFTIIRQPALYATAAFRAAAAALVLVIAAGLLIPQIVKYRVAVAGKYNPYIAGSPIRHAEMLFGREKLIRSVLNTVHNNSIMLYGPRRMGKTSLQYELRRRLQTLDDPEYEFVPVYIDLQGTPEAQFFHSMMSDIVETCRRQLQGAVTLSPEDPRHGYSNREFSRDLRRVIETLKAGTRKKLKLVLLMDEVDTLNKYGEQTNQKLRGVFMKSFAENLVAVMSGTQIKKTWESEGSPWYNFFEEIPVPALERDAALRLICEPVRGIFKYDKDAVARILEYSEGRPYIIQRCCVHAVNRAIEMRRRRIRASDVEAVREQIFRAVDDERPAADDGRAEVDAVALAREADDALRPGTEAS